MCLRRGDAVLKDQIRVNYRGDRYWPQAFPAILIPSHCQQRPSFLPVQPADIQGNESDLTALDVDETQNSPTLCIAGNQAAVTCTSPVKGYAARSPG